jgi:hypothetical protein
MPTEEEKPWRAETFTAADLLKQDFSDPLAAKIDDDGVLVPWMGEEFVLEWDLCDTPTKALSCVSYLCGKRNATIERIDDFVWLLAKKYGWNLD